MSASFQTDQSGIEHQDTMPARRRRTSARLPLGGAFDDAGFAQFAEWDVRIVPRDALTLLPGKASQQQVWFRHTDPLPDDSVLHICALAYLSDLTLLGSAQVNHPDVRKHLMVASLDHAMWFMRPFRADEWLLYDQSSPSACGGRSLTEGKLFNRYGEMVAAVVQEGLTRCTSVTSTPPTASDPVRVQGAAGVPGEHLAASPVLALEAVTVTTLRQLDSPSRLVIPAKFDHGDLCREVRTPGAVALRLARRCAPCAGPVQG